MSRRIKWSSLALVLVVALAVWLLVSIVLGLTSSPTTTGIVHHTP